MKCRAYLVALFVIFVWGVTFVNTRALLECFSALEILVERLGLVVGGWCVCPAVMKIIGKVLYRPLAMVCGRICAVGRM